MDAAKLFRIGVSSFIHHQNSGTVFLMCRFVQFKEVDLLLSSEARIRNQPDVNACDPCINLAVSLEVAEHLLCLPS